MTELDTPPSDVTNISFSIERDGDEYVLNGLNGLKWFSSRALAERCRVLVRGKSNPDPLRTAGGR